MHSISQGKMKLTVLILSSSDLDGGCTPADLVMGARQQAANDDTDPHRCRSFDGQARLRHHVADLVNKLQAMEKHQNGGATSTAAS
jgi:hypothetical protein